MKALFFSICIIITIGSCSIVRKGNAGHISISSLKFLGGYEIPYNQQYNGTTIGGLSGIDYDPKKKVYYLICDDRSETNPARFYTATINISSTGIANIEFVNWTALLKADGTLYPDTKKDPVNSADPEALRYNTVIDQFIWTSEGERIVKNEIFIAQPAITIINKDGRYLDTFTLPEQIRNYPTERGLRRNSSFEGLTFADNYKNIFVSIEEPLYEDGPPAGLHDTTAHTRIIKYDLKERKPVAQYAYRLESIAHPAKPATEFMINGVTDILYIGKNKLLVIERSYSKGVLSNTIRIFLADLTRATNVVGISSLKQQPLIQPASKKLLINMDALGIEIDNIEGVTFGPDLPNGNKTLLFVSDNNFSKDQKTQFLLFEVKSFKAP